jgi:hypothetical protein
MSAGRSGNDGQREEETGGFGCESLDPGLKIYKALKKWSTTTFRRDVDA